MRSINSNVLILLLMASMVWSCKKDDKDDKKTTNTNEIAYSDISPDVEIQSIRNGASELSPNPSDSTVNYMIDLDNDGTEDFKLTTYHSRTNSNGQCGTGPYYTFVVYIDGLSTNNSVARKEAEESIVFIESEVLDSTSFWSPHAPASIKGGCNIFNFNFTSGYIGVRINNNYGYVHVEKLPNNGLRILDYAINKSEYSPIACGQK